MGLALHVGKKVGHLFKIISLKFIKLTKNLPSHLHLPGSKYVGSRSQTSLHTSHTLHSQGCASTGENVRLKPLSSGSRGETNVCILPTNHKPLEYSVTLASDCLPVHPAWTQRTTRHVGCDCGKGRWGDLN